VSEQPISAQETRLRQALRALREDTPANNLARNAIVASVEEHPELASVAREELAWPQAELELHLEGESVEDNATRADWLGRLVTRLSTAVQEVTKSMTSATVKQIQPVQSVWLM
jgi:hypothetical protein